MSRVQQQQQQQQPQQQQPQPQPQHQQPPQPPPLDPRLMPVGPSIFKEEEPHYQRQSHPLPYPVPHSGSAQPRVYSEGPPSAEPAQPQPYYGIPSGRSPSHDIQEAVGSARRESAIVDGFNNSASNNQSPNGDPSDAKRSRACEACRGLKVRCDMDTNAPNEPCKRCKKAGRQCIVTQPSRRRQKKSDTRVAELERKIDALTAVIAQQNGSYSNHANPDPYPFHRDQNDASQILAANVLHHESKPLLPAPPPAQPYPQPSDYPPADQDSQRSNKRKRVEPASEPNKSHPAKPEEGGLCLQHELHTLFPAKLRAKIRELVEPDVMQKLLHHFINNLSPTLPAVPIAPGTTAEDLLESKPFLLFAILSAACPFIVTPETRQKLYDELQAAFSEALIQKGLKSLEVVQALQVTCLWQKPPERPHAANFYIMIHMGAVIALDLGLGKNFNPSKAKRGFGGPGNDLPPGPPQLPLVDSDTIEARRVWMVSYFMCASAAQVLRRPNLLRWTNYMGRCVTLLETSPDAAPSDRMLAQHIKIQHICEEINASFALDDPEATSISILDPKVAYTLNVLESQLRDWEAQIPSDLRKPELMFAAHTTSLYLHEIALHVNHNTDDFRVPFTEASLKSGSEHGFAATLTQNQMTSIEACLNASHNAVEAFCSFDLDTHVVLPTLFYFVRIVYALIVLIKLHVAVLSPGSELGKIIKPEDVKAAEYLDKLWNLFGAIAEKHHMGPHHKAQHIVSILRDWVGTHQHGDSSTTNVAAAKDSGMHAPQKSRMPQDQPTTNSNDNLRVLSEAATAGANQQQPSATWSFESPSAMSYNSYNMRGHQGQHDPGSASSSTVMSTATPQTYTGNDAYGNPMFSQQELGKNDGLEWTAGMDFEQAVNVALHDLDFSGDLFGSFYGTGADAFQIPSDMANLGAANGGGGDGNTHNGGRW